MWDLRLAKVGAWCALAAVVCFVLGVVAMASSGVQVLIPETGSAGREWIADVDAAGGLFYLGAWLIILMGFLGVVAFVGFYDALREAGQLLVLAPVLGVVGLTLVTVSHLIPIAMGYELVPAYTAADPAAQASIAATADTLAAIALATNAAGNVLGWGVVTPLFALAVLRTGALPRWIGWLGLAVGLLAGWVGMLTPAADVFEVPSTLGFFGFFVFLGAMGTSILRRGRGGGSARSTADGAG